MTKLEKYTSEAGEKLLFKYRKWGITEVNVDGKLIFRFVHACKLGCNKMDNDGYWGLPCIFESKKLSWCVECQKLAPKNLLFTYLMLTEGKRDDY